jgi:hypothetical protein
MTPSASSNLILRVRSTGFSRKLPHKCGTTNRTFGFDRALVLNQANLERHFLSAHEKLENLQCFEAFYG